MNLGLYLGALIILALLEVTFALGINYLRPDQDNTALMVMVGVVLVPLMTGILNVINGEKAKMTAQEVKNDLNQTKKVINGQLEERIKASAAAARAEGYHQGKAEAIRMLQSPASTVEVAVDDITGHEMVVSKTKKIE